MNKFKLLGVVFHTESKQYYILYSDTKNNHTLMMLYSDYTKNKDLLILEVDVETISDERKFNLDYVYRHYKNKDYISLHEAIEVKTGKRYAIYQALYGDMRLFARPLSMFLGSTTVDSNEVTRFKEVQNGINY